MANFELYSYYKDHIFYRQGNDRKPLFGFYNFCIEFCIITRGILFIFSFEISYKRTKYVLSILNAINYSIWIIFQILAIGVVFMLFYWILGIFNAIVLFIILFYLIKWSQPEFKATIYFIIYGMLFIITGSILFSLKNFNIITVAIPPIFMIIGIVFILVPIMMDPKFYPKALLVWIIGGVFFTSILVVLSVYLYIATASFEYLTIGLLICTLIGFFHYRTIQIMRQQPIANIESSPLKVLEMFS